MLLVTLLSKMAAGAPAVPNAFHLAYREKEGGRTLSLPLRMFLKVTLGTFMGRLGNVVWVALGPHKNGLLLFRRRVAWTLEETCSVWHKHHLGRHTRKSITCAQVGE